MEGLKDNNGFTLLEVIFAISILTIGILAVAAMQSTSIRGNASAWGVSEATTIAMGHIENLMDLPYDDADLEDLGGGSHGPITSGRYNITWTVDDDQLIARTKTVRVTVTWSNYGLNRNVSMAFTLGQVV